MKNPYDKKFYDRQKQGSRSSAGEIVPIVLQLFHAESVIDIGCGVGTWLSIFKKHGIGDILGLDGDYVDSGDLEIPKESFLAFDLCKPSNIGRKFDLVLCLEVAEHLSADVSDSLVDFLTNLGDVVIFSSAIPYQSGTSHVNEQWPDYWCKLFKNKKFEVFDCIRKRIWENEKVEWWYAQNILVFIREDCFKNYPQEKRDQIISFTNVGQLSLVHPRCYVKRSLEKICKRFDLNE